MHVSSRIMSNLDATAVNMPDLLQLDLPHEWVPTQMYKKALRLVEDSPKYIRAVTSDTFYVLSSTGKEDYHKLSDALIKRYQQVSDSYRDVSRCIQPRGQ